jgi:uncharacterized damage-inducible protein DinB
MDGIRADVEDMLVRFLTDLDRDERKMVWNGADCLNALTMDAEEEIKEQLWHLIKAELHWARIVEAVKDSLKNEPETESEEEEDEEGTASESD